MTVELKSATPEDRRRIYRQIADEMGDSQFYARKEVLDAIPEALHDSEPLLGLTSGYAPGGQRVLALTDRRLLLFNAAKGSETPVALPLEKVVSLRAETGLMAANLYFRCDNDDYAFGDVPKRMADNFARRMKQAMDDFTPPPG
ncbi:PH domain-containing protein [Kushneria aurantia]|uniref:PH domain-containing protein n=1 Tax=Kushneria aurantia TaxID=504092 RepID=A0ABV6G3B7_9GAMM|nr:PH domain-containing protein [Kushneria aurantia]